MPVDVRRAKHIRYQMTKRADMGFDDSGDAHQVFPSEEEEDPPNSLDDSETAPIPSRVTDPRPLSEANDSLDLFADNEDAEPTSEAPRSSLTLLPRAQVRGRAKVKTSAGDGDDLIDILKAQIVQEGLRSDEYRRQREEDRARSMHSLQRDKQDAEIKSHDGLMEMTVMMMWRANDVENGTEQN